MSNRRKHSNTATPSSSVNELVDDLRLPRAYRRASRLAEEGRYEEARAAYTKLESREESGGRLRELIRNDLAVLDTLAGDYEVARTALEELGREPGACETVRTNLAFFRSEFPANETPVSVPKSTAEENRSDHVSASPPAHEEGESPHKTFRRQKEESQRGARHEESGGRQKIAIVSFLFNWPSTGGGNIHTTELCQFLGKAGYDVRHFYANYPDWGIGRAKEKLPFASEGLEFDRRNWNVAAIRDRFRRAIDAFRPDCVLITDAWNMKPVLAEAVRGYPYYLRFQALECLCPLNNLRLLARAPEQVEQCPKHQLATPDACRRCLEERAQHSGQLHQLERSLAGVGTPEYDRELRRALDEAAGVLVLNPLTEALIAPYARHVKVIPWGMNRERFPWPAPDDAPWPKRSDVDTIFMAAVAGEFIKGYHILREACRRLREVRTDFELVVTFEPPGKIDEFTRSVGWISQEELPRYYRAAEICVVPTIAQDGLSRTSVEAMASGRAVVASRIGGLPYTVSDGATGLLFEPGNAGDLAKKIETLLDNPPLRRLMGLAGRRRFEQDLTWDVVVERYYRPLFERVVLR